MAQSLAKIYLHLVFSTKNRQQSLCEQWREEAYSVLGGMANKLGCQSIIVGGMDDHVHMLFQQGRTITVADVVKNIKLGSSKWINETREVTTPFYWQSGYGIFSVSHSQLDIVRE